MKTEPASLLLIAASAAATLAEELRPNDVPLACASICGPMVELTSICQVNAPANDELRRLKRRKLASEVHLQAHKAKRNGDAGKKDKRQLGSEPGIAPTTPPPGQFKTITNGVTPTGVPPLNQAPTVVTTPTTIVGGFSTIRPPQPVQPEEPLQPNPPEEALPGDGGDDGEDGVGGTTTTTTALPEATTTLNLQPTTTPTVIRPVVPPPSPEPASSSSSTSISAAPTLSIPDPNLPIGDGNLGDDGGAGDVINIGDEDGDGVDPVLEDDLDDIKDEAGHLWPGQKERQDAEELESECTCSNESFDVPRVAALCFDCISQMGDPETPMRMIMWECNFTTEVYEPAKESLVANVRVKADKPQMEGQSGSSRLSAGGGWMVVVAVGMATFWATLV